ncbi:hypothetical protein ENBRE01_0656 [Enteropsectra breve]|nr:hypothetical protein ENBRE01_0656 [Enteropsectra breve]
MYKASRKSVSDLAHTIYQSTIIIENGRLDFTIKDPCGNVWDGINAFSKFSLDFEHALPFSNIEEWMGLTHIPIPCFRESFS